MLITATLAFLIVKYVRLRRHQNIIKYIGLVAKKDTFLIGRLHDGVIFLPRPDCFVKMLCYSYLSSLLGVKRQLEKLARHQRPVTTFRGLVSKMTSSYK